MRLMLALSKYIGSLIRGSGRLIKRGENKKLRVRGMIKEVQGMGCPRNPRNKSSIDEYS